MAELDLLLSSMMVQSIPQTYYDKVLFPIQVGDGNSLIFI